MIEYDEIGLKDDFPSEFITQDPNDIDFKVSGYNYSELQAEKLQDFSLDIELNSAAGIQTEGLLIRQSLKDESKYVALVYENGSDLKLLWRDKDYGPVYSETLGNIQFPAHKKLKKRARHIVRLNLWME